MFTFVGDIIDKFQLNAKKTKKVKKIVITCKLRKRQAKIQNPIILIELENRTQEQHITCTCSLWDVGEIFDMRSSTEMNQGSPLEVESWL